MLHRNQILKTPADFDNAMFFGTLVSVWQDGQIIDYGGPITKHDEDTVYMQDGYYFKSV